MRIQAFKSILEKPSMAPKNNRTSNPVHETRPSLDAVLSIHNLSVSIHGKSILKKVSLQIPPKSITCIIGPSGCGKTTLLRSLNRMHDHVPDIDVSGSVIVGNEDLYGSDVEITHLRKRMGLLAQRPTVLPMSIFDNVAYGARIHGLRQKDKLQQLVQKQLVEVGLWEEVKDRLKAPASRLSIGQQQRLCLARALAVAPDVLLGDEATSALDPISTAKIEDLFVRLKEHYSIILVTHTLRQAKRIADYVAFMYMGELIEFGPSQSFFNHPTHALTRDYLEGSFS